MHTEDTIELPVISDIRQFDRNSGNMLERLIFNYRLVVVAICAVLTIVLGMQAQKLVVSTNFEEMIPQDHPYVQNYLKHRKELAGLGNALRIVVEVKDGDIFDPEYLDLVRKINDKVYLQPGVDRAWMKSIWTPATRWTEVTEEGYVGGPVMPFDYDGSSKAIENLRANVSRAGIVGTLVGSDFKSSAIFVPLMDRIAETGAPLSYAEISQFLESDIRALQTDKYTIRIVGFAKLVGDMIDGVREIMVFFGISALLAGLIVLAYTRDLRSTVLLLLTALMGVVWLLGLLRVFGYDLNPYSALVPFLIFAIGLSHGAQKMNGIMQDVARGSDKYVAARYTFRRLFVPGLTALITNVAGFAVLMIIDIPAIRDLALTTSIGVSVLIFTKLFFIPVALSYIGVSRSSAERALARDQNANGTGVIWGFLGRCTERRLALPITVISLCIGAVAVVVSLQGLKIGDIDPGAPELRPDSRYNQDFAYINSVYGASGDPFAVLVKVNKQDGVREFPVLVEQDRLAWELMQMPEVLSVHSLALTTRRALAGGFEGNPKWNTLPRNFQAAGLAINQVMSSNPEMLNREGTLSPIIAYLKDHKADTLIKVSAAVEKFAEQHNSDEVQFLLAAGSAGIEAATNEVVRKANYRILAILYGAVIILCFITFRSWRAVVVAMVPLMITSFLCEALMVWLGIGIKVATLPVIALGVGVGVDYALYLLSVQLAAQRRGLPLKEAYQEALDFTGRVVALIGLTMAAGVMLWVWSPIKFQADMGILLTFMFLWNMVGALVLIPALSYFLLNEKKSPVPQPAAEPELAVAP